MPPAKPHWLQTSTKSGSPDVIVSFDTETQTARRNGQEVLTLRCWNSRIRQRSHGDGSGDVMVDQSGETAGDLVDVLEGACAITGEAWAFAHNAGFDLTVTSLPMILVERGWAPAFVN